MIVQPDDGLEPVRRFISSAGRSLMIKQFTFTESQLIDAVIDRHRHGVEVRVMLNPARSGGDRANDGTYEALRSAGVAVQWSNPKFAVTHEKSMVVDGAAAMIATYNLMPKYFTLTRDYGVVTTDMHQVEQIVEVFEADWAHADWLPAGHHGLLWSNANAREHMAGFIDSATTRLDIQHPKYVDAVILDHIAAASERGVKVRVLCGGKHGISQWDVLDTFASLRTLRRFGVKVHKQRNLRLHAKLLVSDGRTALLGSMNIDRSAFDLRRELGIVIGDAAGVGRLVGAFEQDWQLSRHYHPPDPLQHSEFGEDDFPHDPDLCHE